MQSNIDLCEQEENDSAHPHDMRLTFRSGHGTYMANSSVFIHLGGRV